MIIEIPIEKSWFDLANYLANDLGVLNNSIEQGKGNVIGFLGEEMFCQYTGARRMNTYDYDVTLDGQKIDVKTKRTTVRPDYHYNVSVAAANTKQKCDSYYFVRVHTSLEYGWLLGGIRKTPFYEAATFNRKGEEDNTSGWLFKADCYNLPISGLINFDPDPKDNFY
jgi:hypothetical protein